MSVLAAQRAYAKVNLCLFLGPTRADGRHELVTLFDSITLCDELEVSAADRDEVVCAGVAGRNLVADAIAALRATGWAAPPLRVRIDKHIPVAAGMGGGSADAAALLRLAPGLAPVAEETVMRIAAGLGADVPGQLRPGPSIGTGAGEVLEPVSALPAYGVLVLAQSAGLSTPDVYREADRLGLGRSADALADLRLRLAAATAAGEIPAALIANDLQDAALSLAPAIGDALQAARGAGADHALVCGSGPTVIGLYLGNDGPARADRAARELRGTVPRVASATSAGAGVAAPAPNE